MWPSFVLVLACVAIGHTVPTTPPHYDTIIVGLGAAGCTAAKTLCAAGRKVLGLEAQNRIGGRVYTVPFGDGIVEVGAEWIHGSTHSRTYELAIKNNVTILNQDFDFAVYRSDGSKGDEALVKELLNFSLELTNDPPEKPEPLGQYMTRKLLVYLEKNHPTVAQDQDFVTQFLHTLDLIVNGYEASSSWNDVSTQSSYEELGGSQQLSWHRNGYKTLFEILLNTYNNSTGLPTLDIKLNKEVSTISYPQKPSDNVEVTCKDGTVYTAKNVIVTVSLGVLKERHATLFSTPLPAAKIEAIQTIPIGVVIKIILSFDHVWWSGNSVFIWRGVDKKEIAKEDLWTADVEGGTIMMGCGNCLSFWITGEHVKLVETLPEHEVKTKIMAVIRRFLGKNATIPEPTKMLRSTWFSNPFTRGTYSYENLSTTQHPSAREDLASPLMDSTGAPRVLFAGEATDSIHYSTVHGATDTGFREGSRILSYKGNNEIR